MTVSRYIVTPLGPFATPLRSDTLYGHLLCAAAVLDGPEAVQALINAFEGGDPPFTVSSAFPEGLLPMPVLPQLSRKEFRAFVAGQTEFGGELVAALEAFKRFRSCTYVPEDIIWGATEVISQRALFTRWLRDPEPFSGNKGTGSSQSLEPHNSISRTTGAVLDQGGFYLSEATWYSRGTRLSLYVQTTDRERFERYFSYLADTGYGADRSTGKGHFSFVRDDGFDAAPFRRQGNAHFSLSVCSAGDLSGFSGHYDLFAKYGKAWSGFGERNPFKAPYVAFAEGAVFHRMPSAGYVLRGIHPNPSIVQVVQPLTLPLRLEVGNEA